MLWEPRFRTLRPAALPSESGSAPSVESLSGSGSHHTSQNPFESTPDFPESDDEQDPPVEQVDREFLGTQSFQAELTNERAFAANDELGNQPEQVAGEMNPLDELEENGTPHGTPSKPNTRWSHMAYGKSVGSWILSSVRLDLAPSTPMKRPDFSENASEDDAPPSGRGVVGGRTPAVTPTRVRTDHDNPFAVAMTPTKAHMQGSQSRLRDSLNAEMKIQP